MLHARMDYNAIQPWPTKRPHHGYVEEEEARTKYLDLSDDSLEQLGDSVEPLIPEDEPVFLIRARDVVGPETVHIWANLAEEVGASNEMVTAVRNWADRMEAYAHEHGGSKVPDVDHALLV